MIKDTHVPAEEMQRQYAYAQMLQKQGLGLKYCIVTLGCQMNVRDSETMSGWLSGMGFTQTAAREDADIILYNTCCVREMRRTRPLATSSGSRS